MRKYRAPILGIVLIVLAVIFPQRVDAAISAENLANSSGVDNTSVTSVTYPITITSANILVVGAAGSDLTDADRPVTGVTFNGDALTLVRQDNDDSGNVTVSLWYIVNPDVVTGNIVVSYTGTVSTTGSFGIGLIGANTSAPIDSQNTGVTDNSATHSASTTVVAAGSYVIDSTIAVSCLDAATVDASQTQITNFEPSVFTFILGSYESSAGGSTAMSWAGCNAGSSDWDSSVVSIAPAAAGGGGTPSWKKEYPQETQWL